MKALHDSVILKPLAADTKTSGGLYVPETAQKTTNRGVIVAVGRGYPPPPVHDVPAVFTPLSVKVGETVVYDRSEGRSVEIDGVKHVVIAERHLLAVLSE